MNWQIGSVLVLCVALALGFAWYERSRPAARVLALVAALAALGVIGRLAFAAFPNVKPTSDIVLFSGFALGGPAGFAVGALSALVSNVFLGQGPWTPWQMVAWGVVGLAGAGLGRLLRGREPNRFVLAMACGFAGLVFGALMDMYQWTLAAEHTLSSYLAVSATSFPFNMAHVIGNVVFALALGPAFVRALERYRRRFEVRWLAAAPSAATLLLALVLLLASPVRTVAAPPPDVAPVIARAVHYLRFSQNPDGGFGAARKQSSTQLHTGWAALGLASAGRNPRDVAQRGNSEVDYIERNAGGVTELGEIERTLLVLRSAGLPPKLAGHDLLAALRAKQHPDGSFGTINLTAFGLLALRAGGLGQHAHSVRAAARWLQHAQNRDGGFGFAKSASSDVDDTAAVMQAIAAAGERRSRSVARAVTYLQKAQQPDGGFGQMARAASNAQSTAFAIQGLVAAHRNPRSLKRTRTPVEYLKSLQAADGSVRYSRTSVQTPVWVTAQALVALEGKAFPLPATPRHRAKTAMAPVAYTTTTTAATTKPTADPSSSNESPVRGYIIAVVLGVVMLAGIRLAWRRG